MSFAQGGSPPSLPKESSSAVMHRIGADRSP